MLPYDPLSKRLGGYLIDAGLLTDSQVEVALNDQRSTGMRFGDIIVERGWVKRRTIEYLANKVINMEREIGEPLQKGLLQTTFSRRTQRQQSS
jgi:hypothetical protein